MDLAVHKNIRKMMARKVQVPRVEFSLPDVSSASGLPKIFNWTNEEYVSDAEEKLSGVDPDLETLTNIFGHSVTQEWVRGYLLASYIMPNLCYGNFSPEISSFHLGTGPAFMDGFRRFSMSKDVTWKAYGVSDADDVEADNGAVSGGANSRSNFMFWRNKYELRGFDFIVSDEGPKSLVLAKCLSPDGVFVLRTSDPRVVYLMASMFKETFLWNCGTYIIGHRRKKMLTPSCVRRMLDGYLPMTNAEWHKKYVDSDHTFMYPMDELIDLA
jgi:hypothetical protein